jgi:MFS family permease
MKAISLNRIIKYLILSDLVFWFGWGLLNPIFAIFILKSIQGGDIIVIGIANAIYALTLSLFRIPFGILLDKFPNEDDDYLALILGLFLVSILPFFFMIAKKPFDIYLLQFFHGFGIALSLSGWTAIFTRHIDKGKEATQWGIDATAVGIGTGISGFLGSVLVKNFGFNFTFFLTGIFGLLGTFLILVIKKEVLKKYD